MFVIFQPHFSKVGTIKSKGIIESNSSHCTLWHSRGGMHSENTLLLGQCLSHLDKSIACICSMLSHFILVQQSKVTSWVSLQFYTTKQKQKICGCYHRNCTMAFRVPYLCWKT